MDFGSKIWVSAYISSAYMCKSLIEKKEMAEK